MKGVVEQPLADSKAFNGQFLKVGDGVLSDLFFFGWGELLPQALLYLGRVELVDLVLVVNDVSVY